MKPKLAPRPRRLALPKTITSDQWAESGGSAGIFANGVRTGKIKIIEEELD